MGDASGTFSAYITIIYAKNGMQKRVELWEDLKVLRNSI